MNHPLLDSVDTCIEYIKQTLQFSDISTECIDDEFRFAFADTVIQELEWSDSTPQGEGFIALLNSDEFRSNASQYAKNYYTVLEQLTIDVLVQIITGE